MKTTQKQTARHGNFRGFPKFAIPPELLVLHEVKLLEVSERFGPHFRLYQTIPQSHRN